MKKILPFLFLGFFCSCAKYSFLPKPHDLGETPYGAFIEIFTFEHGSFRGEILAIDTNGIFVYDHRLGDEKNSVFVYKKNIRRYKVRKVKPLLWQIAYPVLTGFPISHGFYALLTLPFNYIYYSIFLGVEETQYTMNNKNMEFKDLQFFARFPGGIPDGFFGVELSDDYF
ncbi:MAG: hypothetical protein JJU02_00690 [Cryomorphaceae bacterium]|nr:hypothetical protein [Cryomorphaceae bacterium]